MYGSPIKSGKGPEVYFSNSMAEDKETQNRVKEMAKKDHEDYINRSKMRHKGAPGAPEFKLSFKPTGPQEYKELFDFDKEKVSYKVPVYAPQVRSSHYDKEFSIIFVLIISRKGCN